ncbi:hypothetical protein NKJ06_21175 [Mesorhizobium sp. M0293]|uniref:hypothetical protein n=1 Tax=Mesorhizobium sp. M0293 TaxID=2956930 RepID=UPI00333C39F4
MTIPQTNPKTDAFADLERDLGALVKSEAARPAHPPAFRQAPAPATMWGPSNPPVTSPLALLAQVADKAHVLQEQIRGLTEALTGDGAGPRTRAAPKLPNGLLPAIAFLAHEIEEAQAEVGRAVAGLRERLK